MMMMMMKMMCNKISLLIYLSLRNFTTNLHIVTTFKNNNITLMPKNKLCSVFRYPLYSNDCWGVLDTAGWTSCSLLSTGRSDELLALYCPQAGLMNFLLSTVHRQVWCQVNWFMLFNTNFKIVKWLNMLKYCVKIVQF